MSPSVRTILAHPGFRRYAGNGAWILLEQVLRGILGVVVGVCVARYLGPGAFGVFAYVISMIALVAAAARLGLDAVLVRNLVDREGGAPGDAALELGTAFWLVAIAGATGLACVVGFEAALTGDRSRVVYLLLAGTLLIAQSFTVVDLFFQSRVRSRPVVIGRLLVLFAASALKLAAIGMGYGLAAFFVITMAEQLMTVLVYAVLAGATADLPRFAGRFSAVRARAMLADSWPLMLTAVAVTLYMRLDQVMLAAFLGDEAVGVYAAAARFYEAWAMLPYLAAASLMPALVRARARGEEAFARRMTSLMAGLFWASLLIGALVAASAKLIVFWTFGAAYAQSAAVLAVLMLASPWAALGTATVRFLLVERMERKIAARTATAAIVSVLMNLALIPAYGAVGAAIANLVAMFVSNYVIDWLDPMLAGLRAMKRRAILGAPFRRPA